MWSVVVVKRDPVTDHAASVLLGFKAMAMDALLFECPNQALVHALLLWAVRRDELLFQAVAAHQRGVGAAGKDQPVIGAKQKGLSHAA